MNLLAEQPISVVVTLALLASAILVVVNAGGLRAALAQLSLLRRTRRDSDARRRNQAAQ